MTTSLGNESKRKRRGNRRKASENDRSARVRGSCGRTFRRPRITAIAVWFAQRRDCRQDTTMGLHRRDLRSASDQNKNAGNGGDVIKHSVYLAVLDELRKHKRWREQLHVLETHAGKGVYAPAAKEYAAAADDPAMRQSKLCAAQARAFECAPDGLGSVDGMNAGERPYAASAVIHAFALRDVRRKSLVLMDHDGRVTDTLKRVFNEPAFRRFCPPPCVQRTESSSEQALIDLLGNRRALGGNHLVHLDPFAFVIGRRHAQERERYAKLLYEADRRVKRNTLAALSVFVVWGRRQGGKARNDLFGAECGVPDGYWDLRDKIGSKRRITVEWCWGQYFAMLLVVPVEVRDKVVERIEEYCKPFESRCRTLFRTSAG